MGEQINLVSPQPSSWRTLWRKQAQSQQRDTSWWRSSRCRSSWCTMLLEGSGWCRWSWRGKIQLVWFISWSMQCHSVCSSQSFTQLNSTYKVARTSITVRLTWTTMVRNWSVNMLISWLRNISIPVGKVTWWNSEREKSKLIIWPLDTFWSFDHSKIILCEDSLWGNWRRWVGRELSQQ